VTCNFGNPSFSDSDHKPLNARFNTLGPMFQYSEITVVGLYRTAVSDCKQGLVMGSVKPAFRTSIEPTAWEPWSEAVSA
jgi:hypothetical protein